MGRFLLSPLVQITGLLSLVYLPFLNSRMIRIAGDEKTYLSQVLEMKERGYWFLQTYAGEPNYYKGPLHFLVLRFFIEIFGVNLWAVQFPNFLWALLGALSTALTFRKFHPAHPNGEFGAGALFGLSAGIYTFVFSCQMEVELAGIFALAICLIAHERLLLFWLVAGLAGWLKSPLHSVLLGVTAILYWALNGSLLERLKSPKHWGFVILGVSLCTAGFAPAYLIDQKAFLENYIHREMLDKPGNGAGWSVPILPFLTAFVFPWTLVLWISFYDGLRRRILSPALQLSLSLVLPSMAFFLWHPYRVQIYNLPTLSGLALCVASLVATRNPRMNRTYSWAIATLPALMILGLGLAAWIQFKMRFPFWPRAFWILAAAGVARGLWYLTNARVWESRSEFPGYVFWNILPSLLAISVVLQAFGNWEISQFPANPDRSTYLNHKKNVWNEWGLISFTFERNMGMIRSAAQVKETLEKGTAIIVVDPDGHRLFESGNLKILPWPRWRRPSEGINGQPAWKRAWNQKDWRILTYNHSVVRLKDESR